jgi:hypothetical protein
MITLAAAAASILLNSLNSITIILGNGIDETSKLSYLYSARRKQNLTDNSIQPP